MLRRVYNVNKQQGTHPFLKFSFQKKSGFIILLIQRELNRSKWTPFNFSNWILELQVLIMDITQIRLRTSEHNEIQVEVEEIYMKVWVTSACQDHIIQISSLLHLVVWLVDIIPLKANLHLICTMLQVKSIMWQTSTTTTAIIWQYIITVKLVEISEEEVEKEFKIWESQELGPSIKIIFIKEMNKLSHKEVQITVGFTLQEMSNMWLEVDRIPVVLKRIVIWYTQKVEQE